MMKMIEESKKKKKKRRKPGKENKKERRKIVEEQKYAVKFAKGHKMIRFDKLKMSSQKADMMVNNMDIEEIVRCKMRLYETIDKMVVGRS